MGFFNISLGCTFKFLPIHLNVGKLEFLNSAYFHILSDLEDSLSRLACVGEGELIVVTLPVFNEKNVHIYITNLCQFECWEYCFQEHNFTRYPNANVTRLLMRV